MNALQIPLPLRGARLSAPHGFFTRQGGVSTGPYATLNCSFSSQDQRACVLSNRARAARAIGVEPENLAGLTQVHGTEVICVETPWLTGAGPRGDAMATNRPGVALGIITADCAPVLLEDAAAGVIGAAHAGWRGAVSGVLEATVAAMVALGAAALGIVATVGPCIAQTSYEVGRDLREAVVGSCNPAERFFAEGRREDRWQFDLAGFCAARLAGAGVGQVDAIGCDTLRDEERFFSHRRRTLAGDGPIGHQISIIALPR